MPREFHWCLGKLGAKGCVWGFSGQADSLVRGTVDNTSLSHALTTLKLQCGDALKTAIATSMESAVGLILKQPLSGSSNVDLAQV